MKEIRIYKNAQHHSPFYNWLNSLKDKTIRARVARRLDRVTLGNFGDFKNLGRGILELRLQFGPGYRIYFAEIDNQIILLLCGGDKSTQSSDLALAHLYWKDFKNRVLI